MLREVIVRWKIEDIVTFRGELSKSLSDQGAQTESSLPDEYLTFCSDLWEFAEVLLCDHWISRRDIWKLLRDRMWQRKKFTMVFKNVCLPWKTSERSLEDLIDRWVIFLCSLGDGLPLQSLGDCFGQSTVSVDCGNPCEIMAMVGRSWRDHTNLAISYQLKGF